MRSILIIGGTKGIGAAVARGFASNETALFLNFATDMKRAEALSESLVNLGTSVRTIRADVANESEVGDLIDIVGQSTTHLDVIVHCAAIVDHGPVLEQDPKRLERSIRIGGLSLFHVVRRALPLLRNGSSVIFLSGNAVDVVLPNHGALAAGKAVGECLVRYLAIECAAKGISFNTLRVGPIDTDLFQAAAGGTETRVLPPITPAGRRLTVEDAANAVIFLASPEASMFRGQTLMLDGGLSRTVR